MGSKLSLSAGAVVLNEEGKILLIRGPKRGWEFPGGVIERGESIAQGIIREVEEESGIIMEITKFCGVYQNLKEGVCATCWLGIAAGGTPRTSDESLEVGFFTYRQVMEMVTWGNFKERIQRILTPEEQPFFIAF
ncbi:NUDIX hydrolase [Bacillus sp. SCS-153A]|uniref:NUDIX hydrolase n=1 Tax=Rossellomorea sedimentorum TaxID=3115294 RepID=UPI0039061271